MSLIESVSHYPSVHLRHRSAPLLNERDEYLKHLLNIGFKPSRVRCTAAYLIHVVHFLEMSSLRKVGLGEVEAASERWTTYESPQRRRSGVGAGTTSQNFARLAKAWLTFHRCLVVPAPSSSGFARQLAEFKETLASRRGLASQTVRTYTQRAEHFLDWASTWHDDLSLISMEDVDRFLSWKRSEGCGLPTIASECQALRSFFGYAEERGWCRSGIACGILSPRLPKYTDVPKGPTWPQVRRLIRSTQGTTTDDLRARAMLLLYSIYALRSSEVAGLRLEDFDWRNETFTVRRAKRGGIQVLPLPAKRKSTQRAFIPYIYSHAEIKALLKATRGSQKEESCRIEALTIRTFLIFLYGTGALVGEALRLEARDVNLKKGLITIRAERFNRTRDIPIGPDMQAALRRYEKSKRREQPLAQYFFTNKDGEGLNVNTLSATFKRVRQQSGIKRCDGARYQPRMHDLRHTFAVHRITGWIRHGADLNRLLPALAAYLGQAGIGSTERYLSLTPERFRPQFDKLSPLRGRRRWRDDEGLMSFLASL
jgi:integrase/recombinase XerD